MQTAYANGASTEYLKNTLGLDVRLAKTGVKNLYATAETFDVGVYFEANGHGSVVFSDAFDSIVAEALQHADVGSGRADALQTLQAVRQVRAAWRICAAAATPHADQAA